jgi:hypothetical protein
VSRTCRLSRLLNCSRLVHRSGNQRFLKLATDMVLRDWTFRFKSQTSSKWIIMITSAIRHNDEQCSVAARLHETSIHAIAVIVRTVGSVM